jgi:hypothetical protein
MKSSPLDHPLRPGDRDVESEASALSALVEQHESFERDVTGLEARLAQGADDGDSLLHERLLRCRRISRKLANRIQVARLQQALRNGS